MRILVLAILAALLLAAPTFAMNFNGTVLQIQPVFSGGSFMPVLMGWYKDQGNGAPSTNGYDPWADMGLPIAAMPGQLRFDLGPIPGAPSDFGATQGDFRAPDLYDTPRRWVITAQIQNNPEHIGGDFGIQAWFNLGFTAGYGWYTMPSFFLLEGNVSAADCWPQILAHDYVTKLTWSNSNWSSSPTQWTMPAPTSTSYYDPDLDAYVTSYGPNPTMTFTIYERMAYVWVPEPGSLLGLITGLGMVGLGIRRRR